MNYDPILEKLLTPDADPRQADRLAWLAYVEWLGFLPADINFNRAAMSAYARAIRVAAQAPAARAFCTLLMEATRNPGFALDGPSLAPARRGGAKARRALF